jgi:hypothetical protein
VLTARFVAVYMSVMALFSLVAARIMPETRDLTVPEDATDAAMRSQRFR